MFVLLSRTQARPGKTVKQEQEELSCNHIQTFISPSVLTKHVADDPGDEHEAIDDGDWDEELVGLQLRAQVALEVHIDVEVSVVGGEFIGVGVDFRRQVIDERCAKAEDVIQDGS